MILAAGLMVLVGFGLFAGAVLTGTDALYWACVTVCAAAAALLVVARRRLSAAGDPPAVGVPEPADPASPPLDASVTAPAVTTVAGRPEPADLPDPGVEDVEVTDLLLVVDLEDEVFVLDERPRYHLAGCVHLRGRTPIGLRHDEARTDGFTPCALCEPDHTLADQVRARKRAASS